jgi:large subunit ribosomal protein L30
MKYLKVTLIKSLNKRLKNHKDCVRGLGLRGRIGETRLVIDSPENRGMINVVSYMLKVEETVSL